ncbi:biopolymer transporter ExbD [Colwellia demingiae]|uniref:Biopolymer transporter ExbD n=1 Tax=Colwellia demingiae TaxID=89401 RepID=A0A5C6QRW5_9GAMM|nr:biopolymer transporter ExbD [Colwellia demingiae]TWX71674.1 biopolymer transporter ExbD [Colwellia demingiae]
MKLSEEPKKSPIVSLTPLIDVVFILLIFFMLVSQFMQLQKQSLPLAATEEISVTDTDSISIRIKKNDTSNAISYRVNNIEMSRSQVDAYLQENKVTEVLLMPEANISLQTFITVKESLSTLGINKINSEFIGYEIN